MRIFATDAFPIPLPDRHAFPIDKYRLVREAVESLGLGPVTQGPTVTDDDLHRAHDPDYVHRVRTGGLTPAEVRRIGFPWSPELVERSLHSAGSTLAACRAALEDGIAVYLGGGTHHAFRDAGEGFCVFNDTAVAARALQAEGRVAQVLVLDCDVHQGNGTAAILAGDPSVWTFSIHGAKNFPLRKVASDLDVPLPDGTGDDAADMGAMERFSCKMAIAPTASISIICGGTSACIEPIPANIYTHKTLSGSFIVKNPYLEKILDKKSKNSTNIWNSKHNCWYQP